MECPVIHRNMKKKDYTNIGEAGFINSVSRSEDGAVQIVEMTLVFPLVLLVVGFLIYLGSYIMQSIIIYNDAQRVAVAASREISFPGYYEYLAGNTISNKADLDWEEGKTPEIGSINEIMSIHKQYRYWSSDLIEESNKSSMEEALKRLVKNSSLLVSSDVECKINTNNYILSQQVQVNVTKHISLPSLFKIFGFEDRISIDVTATAVAVDPAEFIRNTDIVFDVKDYLFESLKFGKNNQSINELISIYKQKFTDIKRKLGIIF